MLYRIFPDDPTYNLLKLPLLQPGDIVELMPGVYTKFKQLPRVGLPESPVIIRAVAPREAIIDGERFDFNFTPRSPFEMLDGAYTIQGLNIRNVGAGASPASGIRCVEGQIICEDLHIRNCGMGLHGTQPNLVIVRKCDIGWCGFGNQSHNIYLSGGTHSIIEDSIIQQTAGGINVKIRTRTSLVQRNRIFDGLDGELQFCNGPETLTAGSDAIVLNNDFRSLANRGRGNMQRYIAFGHEGKAGTDRIGTLFLQGNKIALNNTYQIAVSLDSVNAALVAEGNFITGSSNNLLRIRYAAHAGVNASLNYKNGLAFKDWPLVWTPPAPEPPPDIIAPEVPTNLRATQSFKRIDLFWDHPNVIDVAYFEVDEAWGPYSSGNECHLVHQFSANYPGRTYTYKVVAVDRAGNRSTPSQPFSIIKE